MEHNELVHVATHKLPCKLGEIDDIHNLNRSDQKMLEYILRR